MRILCVENHSVFATNVISQFLSRHWVTVAPSLADARRALDTGIESLNWMTEASTSAAFAAVSVVGGFWALVPQWTAIILH